MQYNLDNDPEEGTSMVEATPDAWSSLNAISVCAEMRANPDSPYWNVCYALILRLVRKSMRRVNLPVDLEEDIIQQIMAAVVRGLPDFRGDSRFTTWLVQVVASKVLDAQRLYIRNNDHQTSLNALRETETPAEPFEIIAPRTTESEALIRERLREAIETLQKYVAEHKNPQRNGIILRLVLLDDRGHEEVAQLLGISPQDVHNVVYAARQYLHRQLYK
jgi:RNA polymerase sigma-70 factor, ECF subfamily